MLDVAQCRLNQRGWGWFAVLFLQVFFQRTGVDADTDGNATVTCRVHHGAHTVFATDVARVDAQAVHTQLGHTQSDFVVEVNVGDQRNLDQLLDAAKGLGSVHVRYGYAHDVHTGGFQTVDLGDCGGNIIGVAVGHALHCDRGIATYRYGADPDLARYATFDWRFAVHDYCPNLRRAVSPLVNGATSTGWPL